MSELESYSLEGYKQAKQEYCEIFKRIKPRRCFWCGKGFKANTYGKTKIYCSETCRKIMASLLIKLRYRDHSKKIVFTHSLDMGTWEWSEK